MPGQSRPNFLATAQSHYKAGRLDEAERACREGLAAAPGDPRLLHLLGLMLGRSGRQDEGIARVRQAAELSPDVPEYHNNLGSLLGPRGDQPAAKAAFERAIALKPDYPAAHANLGTTLRAMRRLGPAIASFRRAIELEPGSANVHSLLSMTLFDLGDAQSATAAARRAVELAPDDWRHHSAMIFTLLHDAAPTPGEIFDQHVAWAARHATPLRPRKLEHDNDRSPDRPLRVGYVSADFREHTRARFVAPVLEHHDPEQFRVYCYSDVERPDALTAWFTQHCARWRQTHGKDDQTLVEMIRRDRIDILVELSGHMGSNRLPLFARKPAPVQIAWPGYPATTGLSTINALIADADRDPPGAEALYTEPLIRLAVSSQCYRPPADVPDVNDLPARSGAGVTFGMTNKLLKVNAATAAMWSRVLQATPGSTLLMIGPTDAGDRELMRAYFGGLGLPVNRIEMVPRQKGKAYWELYHRIDIALDTFPYNGHTTMLDGLWMGVPAITLAGPTHVSREGLAICRLLGLDDLSATTPEEYEAAAIRLAGDVPRLAELRRTLRQRMAASPLRDEAGLTRRIEEAYRQVWRDWCLGKR